jgi:hypothetical protein
VNRRCYRTALILVCCAVVLTTSCVDLSEVARFAAQTTSARSSLASLAADFKRTCERFNQFAPAGEPPQDCDTYARLGAGTHAAQRVLLNYLEALGRMSSDRMITFDQDPKTLPDKLVDSGLDEKAVTATSTIASKLAVAAINGYRRKKLSQLVEDENENVQIVTSALIKIIGTDYKQLLSNERAAMENYYRTPLLEEGKERRLEAVLVTNLWRKEESELAKKQDAADAYATIMRSIADGHQKLYDQRNSLSEKQLFETLGPDIGAIANATPTVHEAFR